MHVLFTSFACLTLAGPLRTYLTKHETSRGSAGLPEVGHDQPPTPTPHSGPCLASLRPSVSATTPTPGPQGPRCPRPHAHTHTGPILPGELPPPAKPSSDSQLLRTLPAPRPEPCALPLAPRAHTRSHDGVPRGVSWEPDGRGTPRGPALAPRHPPGQGGLNLGPAEPMGARPGPVPNEDHSTRSWVCSSDAVGT